MRRKARLFRFKYYRPLVRYFYGNWRCLGTFLFLDPLDFDRRLVDFGFLPALIRYFSTLLLFIVPTNQNKFIIFHLLLRFRNSFRMTLTAATFNHLLPRLLFKSNLFFGWYGLIRLPLLCLWHTGLLHLLWGRLFGFFGSGNLISCWCCSLFDLALLCFASLALILNFVHYNRLHIFKFLEPPLHEILLKISSILQVVVKIFIEIVLHHFILLLTLSLGKFMHRIFDSINQWIFDDSGWVCGFDGGRCQWVAVSGRSLFDYCLIACVELYIVLVAIFDKKLLIFRSKVLKLKVKLDTFPPQLSCSLSKLVIGIRDPARPFKYALFGHSEQTRKNRLELC